MKLICRLKRLISVLLASCFIFVMAGFSGTVNAAESGNNLSKEQQKAALEQKIKEAGNKLSDLKKQSASTKDYLDALNDKIEYLQQEMDYVSEEVEKDKVAVKTLEQKYSDNEKEILKAEQDIDALSVKIEQDSKAFDNNYELYCRRMRAMYVSGDTGVLSVLLTSSDISQFLTRLEMIRCISKQDGALLENIDKEIESITNSKAEIQQKQQALKLKQTELENTKNSLNKSMLDLQSKQTVLDNKRASLSGDRAEANVLLKKLGDDTGYYTEYLEDNKEELAKIDAAIEDAANKYKDLLPSTQPETKPSSKPDSENKPDSTTKPSSTEKEEPNQSKYISLTYPVPSQTVITCPWYGYSGHTGADFKCATGSKVVAAESGIVIISKDLTNDDGSYRSYGRYIVIMHDKTTSSGQDVYTLYAHNSKRLVKEGQYVKKGQQIAESGSTGNSTGPHCHFEVRIGGSTQRYAVNPAKYLP